MPLALRATDESAISPLSRWVSHTKYSKGAAAKREPSLAKIGRTDRMVRVQSGVAAKQTTKRMLPTI